jgi:hypothetical protein
VGLNSLKSLNLTNVYPNNNKKKKKKNNNNNKNNKVKSKPLELRSRVKKIFEVLLSYVLFIYLGRQLAFSVSSWPGASFQNRTY